MSLRGDPPCAFVRDTPHCRENVDDAVGFGWAGSQGTVTLAEKWRRGSSRREQIVSGLPRLDFLMSGPLVPAPGKPMLPLSAADQLPVPAFLPACPAPATLGLQTPHLLPSLPPNFFPLPFLPLLPFLPFRSRHSLQSIIYFGVERARNKTTRLTGVNLKTHILSCPRLCLAPFFSSRFVVTTRANAVPLEFHATSRLEFFLLLSIL